LALSIINIHVNVTGTSTRFFNVLAAPLSISDGTTVAANTFLNDSGSAATTNGVLQEGGSYSVSGAGLTFHTVTGTLPAGTPIIVEAVELVTTL